MWGKRFANVFLGVTCFAMLVKGSLGEVESHCLHQENSTATIKNPEKREIHIGAFFPFLTDDRYGYHTAVKMAINLINNRTDILDNYTLVLDSEDTHWVSAEIRLLPLFVRISLLRSSYFSRLLTAFCFTHIFLSKSRQNDKNIYKLNASDWKTYVDKQYSND